MIRYRTNKLNEARAFVNVGQYAERVKWIGVLNDWRVAGNIRIALRYKYMHPTTRGSTPQPLRVILDLLKYPEKADHKVDAVHQETNAHQGYQRHLIVTNSVANAPFDRGEIARWARKLVVPRRRRF